MTSADLVERSCLVTSSGFRNVLAGNGELCFASKTLNGRQCVVSDQRTLTAVC